MTKPSAAPIPPNPLASLSPSANASVDGTVISESSLRAGKRDTKKGKNDGRSGEMRRLIADVESLRAEVAALARALQEVRLSEDAALVFSRGGTGAAGAASASPLSHSDSEEATDEAAALVRDALTQRARSAAGGAAVLLGYATSAASPGAEATEPGSLDVVLAAPLETLAGIAPGEAEAGPVPADAALARLASAFAAPPKAALVRQLLLTPEPLSAAALGMGANLTTGSLYHHLREMAHAGVIAPAGKSRYALTSHGRFAALLLLALVQRHGE